MGKAELVDGEQVTKLQEDSESDSDKWTDVILSRGCVGGFQ